MYPDERISHTAATFGMRCLGDLDSHPMVGSLRQAKSFLHPSLYDADRPSLRDAALGNVVRGPRGFCCKTPEQLVEAWKRLTTAHPGIKLVLKPASGSGGEGVVLNATRHDVDRLVAQMRQQRKGRFFLRPATSSSEALEDAAASEETILEEMIGSPGKPSPTVYMVGSHVAVVADQLLSPCGTVNLGNVSPASQVGESTIQAMGRACAALGGYLGLHGQWGVDFVIDDSGAPVMVDLNMGRPNGSLSYYCWRARQLPPKTWTDTRTDTTGAVTSPTLALACSTHEVAEGESLAELAASLKAKGLLWDPNRSAGIILAQFLPGLCGGTVLAATWEGPDAARRLMGEFTAHVKLS